MKPSLPSLAGALRQHLGGLVGGALVGGAPAPHHKAKYRRVGGEPGDSRFIIRTHWP